MESNKDLAKIPLDDKLKRLMHMQCEINLN